MSSTENHAAVVRMLALDVDGVLTDGLIYYGNGGEEFKTFNIKDGLGIKMLLVPACAMLIVRAWSEPGLIADVAVLEASMPPMLSAAALASMAGLAPELCAALAGYGIVIALVFVPLLAGVL